MITNPTERDVPPLFIRIHERHPEIIDALEFKTRKYIPVLEFILKETVHCQEMSMAKPDTERRGLVRRIGRRYWANFEVALPAKASNTTKIMCHELESSVCLPGQSLAAFNNVYM